ncbi:MAG TPA: TolC family protein, partial [Gemmatimonadales bacterium]|nr:TolC family protein [Gemmatimonadales bacterium]
MLGRRRDRATWLTRAFALAGCIAMGTSGPTLLPAQSSDSLTLRRVYQLLSPGTPRVLAAEAAARAAGFRIAPARRLPDPQLQFGLMNRSLPGLGLDPVLGMNQIQLMQMIPTAGKLGLSGRVAQFEADAARARAAEIRWEERTRAVMAFYELYQVDRGIVIAEATQRLLRDIVTTTETMYSVGEGRQPDVLRAQVEVARMTEDLTRMRAMRLVTASRLNAVLNQPADTPVPSPVLPLFPDSLPPADTLIALALRNRPMLTAGASDVSAAESAERRARREIWPDLEAGVQYGWRSMDGGTDRMVSLMLGVTVPLWAGSRQLAMRRETQAMREMAEADLTAMQADTRGRVGEVYAEADRARTLLTLYRSTVLPQSQATVAASQSAYRSGSVDFMTLLDAQMNVNRYQQELVRL